MCLALGSIIHPGQAAKERKGEKPASKPLSAVASFLPKAQSALRHQRALRLAQAWGGQGAVPSLGGTQTQSLSSPPSKRQQAVCDSKQSPRWHDGLGRGLGLWTKWEMEVPPARELPFSSAPTTSMQDGWVPA